MILVGIPEGIPVGISGAISIGNHGTPVRIIGESLLGFNEAILIGISRKIPVGILDKILVGVRRNSVWNPELLGGILGGNLGTT